ncbi:MAG: hypothetical protein QNK37_05120 [Acidobacteriota bacterium]|nr:hypothetical protein [Acidobacteriota bacterium]
MGKTTVVSNGYALVGAPVEDRGALLDAGAAYLYEEQIDTQGNSSWSLIGELAPSLVEAGAEFGAGVAIEGSLAAIGAPMENGGDGAVYLYEQDANDPTLWTQIARMQGLDPGEQFGKDLDFDETAGQLIIGGLKETTVSIQQRGV